MIHNNGVLVNDLRQSLVFFNHLSTEQRQLLENHLHQRVNSSDLRSGLGVVYDVTRWCNQGCVLCCTNAKRISPHSTLRLEESKLELNTQQVFNILHKIKDYVERKSIANVFINFGGGEPFLRPDFSSIILETSKLFGAESVGFDNNGTRATIKDMEEIKDNVSYIGISIDGLETYHNKWRNTGSENGFQLATSYIRSILKIPGVVDKLEVSTVATKANLEQIPQLMRFLHSIGVQKYSIHRTMQVGRAWLNYTNDVYLPDAADYLKLMVSVLEANQELNMDVHLHHSIESIYATLLLGYSTYSRKPGNPDRRSSIGIDWNGRVFFDPWCLVEPLSLMFAPSAPSLAAEGVTLEDILDTMHSEVRERIEEACSLSRRCLGCPMPCSGGSRIGAAFYALGKNVEQRKQKAIDMESVLSTFDQIDPLCPLFAEGKTVWVKSEP